jgi:hypothetical protein
MVIGLLVLQVTAWAMFISTKSSSMLLPQAMELIILPLNQLPIATPPKPLREKSESHANTSLK